MDVLQQLSAALTVLQPDGRLVVGVDGPDAAGKTTFADRAGPGRSPTDCEGFVG